LHYTLHSFRTFLAPASLGAPAKTESERKGKLVELLSFFPLCDASSQPPSLPENEQNIMRQRKGNGEENNLEGQPRTGQRERNRRGEGEETVRQQEMYVVEVRKETSEMREKS